MRIGLFKGKSLGSRLIGWQTRSVYSHAAFLEDDGSVIEAWYIGGVQRNPSINTVHEQGTVVDTFHIQGFGAQEATHLDLWIQEHIDKRYDFAGILGFVDRASQRNDDKWFCSELCFAGLVEVGIIPLARIEAWSVSPGTLALAPCLVFSETLIATIGKAKKSFL